MMFPKPITLHASAILERVLHSSLTPTDHLYVDASTFVALCGCSPTGAASISDTRYRVRLTVLGVEEVDGVYFVSGWTSKGLGGICHLTPDPAPRRREAILAQKAR